MGFRERNRVKSIGSSWEEGRGSGKKGGERERHLRDGNPSAGLIFVGEQNERKSIEELEPRSREEQREGRRELSRDGLGDELGVARIAVNLDRFDGTFTVCLDKGLEGRMRSRRERGGEQERRE